MRIKPLDVLLSCAYDKSTQIIFDPAKDVANIAKHGLALADFDRFDSEPSVCVDDR